MHVFVIGGNAAGIFRHTFETLGSQVFFFGLINMYVYVLIFISWPVKVRFQNYRESND